ncbi:MAG TPA: outer membrane beta-barrel protein, partial [Steroidobacteraceae bacterium]|nr:outer membrane beta-barrel protein [Steroidobacteraceae bacterium]
MPRHFVLTTFAAGLAAMAALDAQAAQPGFYVGGAYLETSSNARQQDFDGLTQAIYDQFGFTLLDYASTFEDEDSGYEILGGYRLLEWLAFEVGYLDLGAVEQRATAAVELEGDSFTIDSRLKSETQGLALTAL